MAQFRFPKPTDWNVLEDITCDVFSRRFDNHNFQRYGRSGQKQLGIDIVGSVQKKLLGIQCKHHPDTDIPISEIDDAISLSEQFYPPLGELIIVTSAARDNKATNHVLSVSAKREAEGKHPVHIGFWEDIVDWLGDYPDLIYKHFTKYFPQHELEHIRFSNLESNRHNTLCWPVNPDELIGTIDQTIGGIERVNPYKLAIGLSSFTDVHFKGLVDLEISLEEQFNNEQAAQSGFAEASQILNDLRAMIQPPHFSKELFVHMQTRLTLALLFGWMFRKVSGFQLQIVSGGNIWATSGLPLVVSGLTDDLPQLRDQNSHEVVLVLNISRSIEDTVVSFVDDWEKPPKAILVLSLPSRKITSAAHALSIALEISQKIKSLVDRWQMSKIHLFGAMPAPLATLIGFHLNAICPISIYFRDDDRTSYILGGTLTNNL